MDSKYFLLGIYNDGYVNTLCHRYCYKLVEMKPLSKYIEFSLN